MGMLMSHNNVFKTNFTSLHCGDALELYEEWDAPDIIISDGAYGVSGFDGDTHTPSNIPDWYEPHIKEWTRLSKPNTTLWFWNTEIGWALAHPVIEKNGWRYVGCNTWNKGSGHIAGNINTSTIKRFPPVTEVCAHYVREPQIGTMTIKKWIISEWKRSGLPLYKANEACGVKNAASRKYLTSDHLWYRPPPDAFEKMVRYANQHGDQNNAPYYSLDGINPMTRAEWINYQPRFACPYGTTNVWELPPLRGKERVKTETNKAAHPNQKPLVLLSPLIETTTESGGVVWEPFGGMFSAALAAESLGRLAFAAEINPDHFKYATQRFTSRAANNKKTIDIERQDGYAYVSQ